MTLPDIEIESGGYGDVAEMLKLLVGLAIGSLPVREP